MKKLVVVRHGESEWNRDNRFTGWRDVDLTERGRQEARSAGKLLRDDQIEVNVAFTSVLKRSIITTHLILEEMGRLWIPLHCSWRLNERSYGALEGLNKTETARLYGREQVYSWRRGFRERPPKADERNGGHPRFDPRYRDLDPDTLPNGESLEDTCRRFLPYWTDVIEPALMQGKGVLVVAHGNSLRALVKHIEGVSDDDIVTMNLPTAIPRVYDLDSSLRPINGRFRGDVDGVQRRIDEELRRSCDPSAGDRRPRD